MATSSSTTRTYTAFISYRHTDVDLQVAKEIHRKLERYHLDRDVRERSGFASLAPIFRDQDELPISSALDDDLVEALHNASALIVVCSPRLKESQWCMREIDEFLRTHDRSRVFVALAEGEPHDVVPDQLLHRVGPDGSLVDVEPLAANFRAECKGSERRGEVTRLAAGILGVPYDSLVKRAQRRRQRIGAALATAAVAASTAFGFYNAYMNAQIRVNYRQALQRRSEYLATEAIALVSEGNTIGATELAMAALPSDESAEAAERPVVPDAVYALQQATNAGFAGSTVGQYTFTTTEVYGSEADLRQMHVSPNERYVATVDETEVVSAWEVAGHRLIFQGRSSIGRYEDVIDAFVLDTGETLVVYKTGVVCRDAEDGSVLWDCALGSTDEPMTQACISGDQARLLVASNAEAHIVDLASGKDLHHIAFAEVEGMPQREGTQMALMVAPHAKGERFCLAVSQVGDAGFAGCVALVVDAKTGVAQAHEVPGVYAFDFDLLEDGSIVLMLGANATAQDVSNRTEAFANTYTTTLDFDVTLACLDGETGTLRWSNDVRVWQVCYDVGFQELRDTDGQPDGTVACWLADRLLFVDARTGEVRREHKTAASIVGASVVGDGQSVMGMQADGSFFVVGEDDASVLSYGLMHNDLYYADVRPSGELYVVKDNVLYAYRGAVYDGTVRTLEVGERHASWEFAAHEGIALAYLRAEDAVLRVQLCSAPELEVVWQQDFGADDELLWYVLGFDEDEDALLLVGMDYEEDAFVARRLVRLVLGERKVERLELATCDELGLVVDAGAVGGTQAAGLVVGNAYCYRKGVVYSQVVDAEGTVCIAAASLVEGRTRLLAVDDGFGEQADRSGRSLYLLVDPTGERLLYQDKAGAQEGDSGLEVHRTAVLDLSTGESVPLDRDVATIWHARMDAGALQGHAVWSDDGAVLATVSAEGVALTRFDGRGSVFVPLDGRRVAGATIVGDRLVVMLSMGMTGQLESFDVVSGERLASRPIDDGNDAVSGWTSVSEALAADGSGDLFFASPSFGYLVDLETLSVCQRYALGRVYAAASDALLCDDAAGASYHAFDRYSLAGLLERGRTMLGSQTMGTDWLAAHGA